MVILTLILSSPRTHIVSFLEVSFEIEGKDNFSQFLNKIFRVGISILTNEAFPKTWLNVNILAHQVFLKLFEPIAALMIRHFIPEQKFAYQFNSALWRDGFYLLLKLLSSDQLVIEEFSPQKRRAVWRLAGDIRGEGAGILLRLWEALGWPETVSAHAGAITRYGVSMSFNFNSYFLTLYYRATKSHSIPLSAASWIFASVTMISCATMP